MNLFLNSDDGASDHLILLLDHQSGCKESLQTLLQYPYLCRDYLTQLNVLKTDL